jgi:hypothetical protein
MVEIFWIELLGIQLDGKLFILGDQVLNPLG